MRRRDLLTRTLTAWPLGAAACVAPPPAPPALEVRVVAPRDAPREARLAAWNDRFASEGLRLVIEPLDADAAPAALEARLASSGGEAALLWTQLLDVPRLAHRRRLRSLDALVRRDRLDLKRFMPPALQPGYGHDGRLHALPEEVDARQLYFNRDHLADAGIDYRRAGLDFEAPHHTWEALRRASLDLLSGPRSEERLPFHVGHDGAPFDLWVWQNGGALLDGAGQRMRLDGRESVEALAWLAAHSRELGGPARLARAGAMPPTARTGTDADDPAAHPFVQGRLSLCFESTRFVSTVAGRHPDFPLGYVEPPRRRPGAPLVSSSRSWGYLMAAETPDRAWPALRFLVSEDAARAAAAAAARAHLAQVGPHPAADPAAAAGRLLWQPPFCGQLDVDRRLAELYRTGIKLLDEGRDHGLEQLRHARPRPPCVAARDVWPQAEAARRAVVAGQATAAEALAAAQHEAQTRLDAAWQEVSR
jgi:ABC-type glycerol-3-phosphate transport system substrate-binding protein